MKQRKFKNERGGYFCCIVMFFCKSDPCNFFFAVQLLLTKKLKINKNLDYSKYTFLSLYLRVTILVCDSFKVIFVRVELKGYRGKASDGTVLPLELAYFVNAVYGQLQLCTNPSRGGVNTLSPPPPLCLQTDNFLCNPEDVYKK